MGKKRKKQDNNLIQGIGIVLALVGWVASLAWIGGDITSRVNVLEIKVDSFQKTRDAVINKWVTDEFGKRGP